MTEEVTRVSASAPAGAATGSQGKRNRGGASPWERYGWLMAIIWLVFLGYPIYRLLGSQATTAWIVTGWVALVAFVVVYVAGFINGMSFGGGGLTDPPKPIQWVAFAVLIVCAALTVPAVGGSALSFLPFIMSFASYGLTRLAHWLTFAASIIIAAAVVFLTPEGLAFLTVLAIIVLLGVVNTVSTTLIIRSSEAERLGLELATSEGREMVARDVHDLIGHSLTVVQLKAQLAARLVDTDPQRAKAELADITALTAEAIAGVRSTVAGARATTLVEQLASGRDALRAAGVAMHVEGAPAALSPVQSLTASWVLREAITNVLRHAQAKNVTVTIVAGRLVVVDDGRGPASDGASDTGGSGNGVRGMRERAAASGAALEFGADAAGGTRVEIRW